MRDSKLDAAECVLVRAANMLRVYLAHTLAFRRVTQLVIRDDGSPRAACDRDRVAYVIAVSVRDQNEVRLQVVGLARRRRLPRQERVDEHRLAAGKDRK